MEIDSYILDKFLSERDNGQYYLTRKKIQILYLLQKK